MDIKQVETFLEIMRAGSFTTAAENLGYAQSTITGHVSQLESSLSVQLFERTSKTKRPTKSALAFLPYAREFVAVRDRAVDAMLAVSQQMGGRIVVGTSETVCITSLAEPLAAFSATYPGVELSIRMMDCSEASKLLRLNEIDLAFFTGEPLVEKGLKTLAARWETMALAFRKGRFSEADSLTTDLLPGEHYLVSARGCVFRTLLERHLKIWGDRPPRLMEVGSIQVVKNLCACNLGLAFLPRYALEKEIREGQLECMIPEGVSGETIATQIVVHENKALTPAMTILIDQLRSNLLTMAEEASVTGHPDEN